MDAPFDFAGTPFKPEERVIEYLLRDDTSNRLVRMSLADFTAETASESAAPARRGRSSPIC